MNKYIFSHVINSNIKININAQNYTQAMDLLLSVTRNIDDYRLKPDGNESADEPFEKLWNQQN